MASDLGLGAIQEALRQSGCGDVLPLLPYLLLGAGAVLVYFGCAWLPEEVSQVPLSFYQMGWERTPPATLGMLLFGVWLIFLGFESLL